MAELWLTGGLQPRPMVYIIYVVVSLRDFMDGLFVGNPVAAQKRIFIYA